MQGDRPEQGLLHAQRDGSMQTTCHADAPTSTPNKQPFLQQLQARMAARRAEQTQHAPAHENMLLQSREFQASASSHSPLPTSPGVIASPVQTEEPISEGARTACVGLTALRSLPSPRAAGRKRTAAELQPKSWDQLVRHRTPSQQRRGSPRLELDASLSSPTACSAGHAAGVPSTSPMYIMPSTPPSTSSFDTSSSPTEPGREEQRATLPQRRSALAASAGEAASQQPQHQQQAVIQPPVIEKGAQILGDSRPQLVYSPVLNPGTSSDPPAKLLESRPCIAADRARAETPSSADHTGESSDGQAVVCMDNTAAAAKRGRVASTSAGKRTSKLARVVYPPGTFAQLPGEDPRVCLWQPPASPFSLLEEVLYDNPWALLLACILLNKTSGTQVRRALGGILRAYPTPEALAAAGGPADQARLQQLLHPLGLYRSRAARLVRFSQEYLSTQWSDPRKLHGVGQYGADAYAMFCRGAWQQMPAPADKDLRKYWEWLHATGTWAPPTQCTEQDLPRFQRVLACGLLCGAGGHGEGLQRESLQQILAQGGFEPDMGDAEPISIQFVPDEQAPGSDTEPD